MTHHHHQHQSVLMKKKQQKKLASRTHVLPQDQIVYAYRQRDLVKTCKCAENRDEKGKKKTHIRQLLPSFKLAGWLAQLIAAKVHHFLLLLLKNALKAQASKQVKKM